MNIRGLVEWHLVRRTRVAGSRKDHYEAATDFWRVMQEIMERRFRWNLRQCWPHGTERAFIERRLEALRAFFAAVDAGIGAQLAVRKASFAARRDYTARATRP